MVFGCGQAALGCFEAISIAQRRRSSIIESEAPLLRKASASILWQVALPERVLELRVEGRHLRNIGQCRFLLRG
jgi:hypothetical protein